MQEFEEIMAAGHACPYMGAIKGTQQTRFRRPFWGPIFCLQVFSIFYSKLV